MSNPRDIPVDFVENMNESNADLMKRYGCGSSALYRWFEIMRQRGVVRVIKPTGAALKRPIPIDFAKHAHEPIFDQAKRWKCGVKLIHTWLKESGIVRAPKKNGIGPIPRPADFERIQDGKTIIQLVAECGVSRNIIQRWLSEIGIKRSAGFAKGSTAKVSAKPAHSGRPFVSTFTQTGPVDRAYKEDSRAGAAARYLQPDYIPTYRCRADGTQDIAGKFWRCGRRVAITDAEIIALADEVRARNERRRAA
jgi:transposase